MIKRLLTFDSSLQESVLVDFISQNKVKILHKVKTCQNCLHQKFPYKNEEICIRLSNSDLKTIINCTNLTIDPTNYALLQKAQPTSAAVERSFSMLSKLLRKDRNFDVKNVKKYMMLYYNKKSW